MKWLVMIIVVTIRVDGAPLFNQPMMNQQMDQSVMNQVMHKMMEQQMMEQMMQQHQYNALQQQLMGLQQQIPQMNSFGGPVMIRQPILILLPTSLTKSNNRIDNPNSSEQPNLKFSNEESEAIVIDASESNTPEMEVLPRQAILVLPNGQRFFIGSIISAIPFLPFEVNVPDTIAWIYNGISGIIGGIGQRLPFRPRPTSTESPEMMETQETTTPVEENNMKLMQKLQTRKRMGMPILMLRQAMQIQLPIQV